LPSHTMMEYSMTGEDVILEEPFRLGEDGILHVHEVPGHGLELNAEARQQLSKTQTL
jgi:L-alanine-DL-glutamate epimerase-like enolase superfamily enzyme